MLYLFLNVYYIPFDFHSRKNESLVCGLRERLVEFNDEPLLNTYELITEDKHVNWSEAECVNEHVIYFHYSPKKSSQPKKMRSGM